MPIDLQYFVEFELRDRERRSTDGSLRRQVPTSSMYKAHLLREGKIPAGASSGLYRRIFLKDYVFADFGISAEALGITTQKPWHGAPIAIFPRAFHALASFRIFVLEKETICQLRRLHDLYFWPSEDNRVNLTSRRFPPDSQSRIRFTNDDDEQPASKKPKLDGTREEDSENVDRVGRDTQQHDRHASEVGGSKAEWVLGPNRRSCSSLRSCIHS